MRSGSCFRMCSASMAAAVAAGVFDAPKMYLRQVWRRLWESTNKPFGFEVLDFRMGGIIARLKTAADRLAAYSRGEIDDIPELSGETFLLKRREDNSVSCTNTMAELLTAARLDHPF